MAAAGAAGEAVVERAVLGLRFFPGSLLCGVHPPIRVVGWPIELTIQMTPATGRKVRERIYSDCGGSGRSGAIREDLKTVKIHAKIIKNGEKPCKNS